MSSESPPQMRKLSDFTRTFPENDELKEAMAAFSTGSDGAVILLAGAWLDNYLARLIIDNFKRKIDDVERKDLFEQPFAPLHTLNAKLRLARANGLIAELVYNQIVEISYVRNVFAHSPYSITCDTPEIALRCNRLEFSQLKLHFLELTGMQFPAVASVSITTGSGPRFLIVACSLLLLGILLFHISQRLRSILDRSAVLTQVAYCKICEIEYILETNKNKYFSPLPHRKWMLNDWHDAWPDMFLPRSL